MPTHGKRYVVEYHPGDGKFRAWIDGLPEDYVSGSTPEAALHAILSYMKLNGGGR